MVFIPSDNTGLADANSYIDVATFKAYHDERGNDYSSMTPDTKIEEALVRSTDYVERRFGPLWKGCPEFEIQALHFPALQIYDRFGRELTGIPVNLQGAIAEYALRADTQSLFNENDADSTGQNIQRFKEKIGPIEEETEFAIGSSIASIKKFPIADKMLTALLNINNGVIRG